MTDKSYWDTRWKNGQTGWDLKTISPPIKQFIDSLTDKNLRILIPGCGSAYEAEYLLQNGFNNVTVIDISPTLVQQLSNAFSTYLKQQKLKVICIDFFELNGLFDVIIEQTFFCALHPDLRKAYVEHMPKLLDKNGLLTGLLFNREFEGGPPFGGNVMEYETLFKPHFSSVKFMPCLNSAAPRLGSEVWFEAKK